MIVGGCDGGNSLGGSIHTHKKSGKRYVQYTVNGVHHKTYEGSKKFAEIVGRHSVYVPTRKVNKKKYGK